VLTDTEVARTKPDPLKELRLADAAGLHLIIQPTGSRFWRWDYAVNGRRKTLSFGKYPIVTLKRAREKQLEAQRLLDAGKDPSVERKQRKQSVKADTFEAIATAYLKAERAVLRHQTYTTKAQRVNTYLIPVIGKMHIGAITAGDVLPVIEAIAELGQLDTAHRVRALASDIFCFAISKVKLTVDPVAALRKSLPPNTHAHHPSLTTPTQIAPLLNAIDHADDCTPAIAAALRLAPLVMLRPRELRCARWEEIDLDAAMWRVPAARMKPTKDREAHPVDHLVPLSTQAVTILRSLKVLSGTNPLVFPGVKSPDRPISDATLPSVLRRLSYPKEVQSIHGFRTLASTNLREIGWENDLVELQLSHQIANKVRAAYDRAARVPERVVMMQALADFLDDVKAGRVTEWKPRVVPFPAAVSA
jgi:integrase